MPVALRKIRRAKWFKHPDVPWLPEGELQADALTDLKTDDNGMSVWIIDDERSNLDRVIAALAANRDILANFDYAFWDIQLISGLNIRIQHTAGDSKDAEANNTWHRDLSELTASKLMALAKAINEKNCDRISEKKVQQLIAQAVTSGHVERTTLSLQLGAKIDDLPPT